MPVFLKLAGAFLVVSAAGLAGMHVASFFWLRPQQLRALQAALQMLDTEIMYAATPLPAALKKIGQAAEPPVGAIFFAAGELLGTPRGCTAAEAWRQALLQEWEKTALNKEDFAILRSFGEGLGVSDREEQHKNIALTSLHLRREEERAERDRDKNVRLWRYGGFLAGIGIVLLFL
ncbi:MAG: stage III sporulation protein AB [Firmicutes bacterium]|nr:stage III sporulation protein AB [Bacillota bacterium]